jgi:hypothetical protein
MLLEFRKFLEDEAGVVHTSMMANTAVADGFMRLRSKYMMGNIPQRKEPFDPEDIFGKRKTKRQRKRRHLTK